MNQNRILCRLRSSHAKRYCNFKKVKLARPQILPQVFQLYREKGALELPSSFDQELDDLENHFVSLESMEPGDAASIRGAKPIVGIVQIIHRLWLNQDFRSLFPPGMLGSTLAKLSRYVSAAYFLAEEARRQSILATLKVEIVVCEPLPGAAYVPSPKDLQSLLSTLASPTSMSQLRQHVGARTMNHSADTELLVSSRYGDLVNAKCAVHAEIQLLFHYEFRSPCLPPQVICSTKKACYFCNLFFALHGRFTMLATHGRLYEKWTLPNCIRDLKGAKAKRMYTVIERFYDAIVKAIRDALVFSRKKAFASNESLFLRSTIWPAATRVFQTPVKPAEACSVHSPSFPNPDAQSHAVPFEPSSMHINGASVTPQSISPPAVTKETTRSPCASHTLSSMAAATTTNPALPYRLDEGTSVTLQITDPATVVRVNTKNVHFTFCSSIDPTMSAKTESSGESPRQTYATVEYFNAEQRFQNQPSNLTCVDIAALVPGVDVVLDQHTEDPATHGFYISYADSMFYVRCWNGD
jgi:hypothetical protein